MLSIQSNWHQILVHAAGVIVESEDLHREAYNASFAQHEIRCGGSDSIASWSEAFYDDLSNKVGGGKPKMRWYFGKITLLWFCSPAALVPHDCFASPANTDIQSAYENILGCYLHVIYMQWGQSPLESVVYMQLET